jgi:hypothetical protein
MHHWQSRIDRFGVDSTHVAAHKRVRTDVERVRTAHESRYSRLDVINSPDFRCYDPEVECPSRCLYLANFQNGTRITRIGHNRQPAQTRDNLTQEFQALAGKFG